MKAKAIDAICNICPNIFVLRKILSVIRIRRTESRYIPKEDVELGESSYNNMLLIVDKYLTKKWKGIYETEKAADHILDKEFHDIDPYKKKCIKADMLFCRLAYGFQPEEYLCFELEKQDKKERKKWISDLDRYLLVYSMNDCKDSQIFNNKARTYKIFKNYYGREAISIKRNWDFFKFESFINKHKEFVKKPVYEGMGKGVELIKSDNIQPKEYFYSLISSGEHIIEERIIPSKVMSDLNTSSVNTIRCITLSTKNGIEIPYTFLKVGRNGSFVDNGGSGGILAGIDVDTGEVITHGYDEFGEEYTEHPDSRINFKGYVFPEWKAMRAMCCEMARKASAVKCIGWDVTYTDKGWIMVEGNGRTQFIVPQIVFKRGIKSDVLVSMENTDLICSIPEKLRGGMQNR